MSLTTHPNQTQIIHHHLQICILMARILVFLPYSAPPMSEELTETITSTHHVRSLDPSSEPPLAAFQLAIQPPRGVRLPPQGRRFGHFTAGWSWRPQLRVETVKHSGPMGLAIFCVMMCHGNGQGAVY